jgi:hypothetical protein
MAAGGRGFGRPVTLLTTQALDYEHNGAVSAAIGPGGRGVIVFADVRERPGRDRRLVLAWTHGSRGGFSRTLVVGPHAGFARMACAVTDSGRVFVAWGTQDGGEEAGRPWIVRAATLARGARRFSKAQTLDPGRGINRPVGVVALAVEADGRATAAWSAVRRTSYADLSFPVTTATSDRTGHFARATEIAPFGAVGGLAVRADGAAIVTWARTVGEVLTGQASAAVRPAGAPSFGAAEAIADPDVASPPTAAFNPMTGSPTVAWAARPNGVDPSLGNVGVGSIAEAIITGLCEGNDAPTWIHLSPRSAVSLTRKLATMSRAPPCPPLSGTALGHPATTMSACAPTKHRRPPACAIGSVRRVHLWSSGRLRYGPEDARRGRTAGVWDRERPAVLTPGFRGGSGRDLKTLRSAQRRSHVRRRPVAPTGGTTRPPPGTAPDRPRWAASETACSPTSRASGRVAAPVRTAWMRSPAR